MLRSMTGFGSKEAEVNPFGRVCVELKSSNHKFLETVFHLPEGFLSLEDRIKKEIEAEVKRGRVTCAINIAGGKNTSVFINRALLRGYISQLKEIKRHFSIKDEISINTLIHLPGIISLEEQRALRGGIWPRLRVLIRQSLDELIRTRQREGRSLCIYLKKRADALSGNLAAVKRRFKEAIKARLSQISSDEERISFLKETDIAEEIERLEFHIRNFKNKVLKSGPVGKELDFIAQEMQREANTVAAKSFDAAISGKVVQLKSQIEKIREQVQNIE